MEKLKFLGGLPKKNFLEVVSDLQNSLSFDIDSMFFLGPIFFYQRGIS
jgi:hypothetical protein